MSLMIATTLGEALTAMASGARPIAGGTDLVVGSRAGKAPLPHNLVAIDRIEDLRSITEIELAGTAAGDQPDYDGTWLRIGATATHAQLMQDEQIMSRYSGVADASALVGSPATRNVGTLGGNVMNASPAMDTGAPLLALGSIAILASTEGSRLIPLQQLWSGPGSTTASASELCIAILIPKHVEHSGSAYVRLEYRRAMEIAVVGAGAAVSLHRDGSIAQCAVALTAVAATIKSVAGLDDLAGRIPDQETLELVSSLAMEQATPISDLRASDRYRRHTVGVMAKRAVEAAARRASGESIEVPVNRAYGIGATS